MSLLTSFSLCQVRCPMYCKDINGNTSGSLIQVKSLDMKTSAITLMSTMKGICLAGSRKGSFRAGLNRTQNC